MLSYEGIKVESIIETDGNHGAAGKTGEVIRPSATGEPGRRKEVNPKLSERMTLLGIGTMVLYGVMLGAGYLTTEVMPQFLVSAVIFLSSGRLMKKVARALSKEEEPIKPPRKEPDWPWLTALLNWTAAFLVLGIMAIFLMKPVGLTFEEALSRPHTPEHYFATDVP